MDLKFLILVRRGAGIKLNTFPSAYTWFQNEVKNKSERIP